LFLSAREPELQFQCPKFVAVFLQNVGGFEQLSESLLVVWRFLVLLGHDYFFYPRALILLQVPRQHSYPKRC
jgi:hypothetical protein